MPSVSYLTVEQVEHIHDRVIAETGGSLGIVNRAMLESAVERPRSGIQGHEFYPTLHEKTAAVLHSIITTHPFADGNKRTAMTVAEVFLTLNGHELSASQFEFEEFAVQVAVTRPDVAEVAEWVRRHTRTREGNASPSR